MRELSPAEAASLRKDVFCSYLPDATTYAKELEEAGFKAVAVVDLTKEWASFIKQVIMLPLVSLRTLCWMTITRTIYTHDSFSFFSPLPIFSPYPLRISITPSVVTNILASQRASDFIAKKDEHVRNIGAEAYSGLEFFYSKVAELFEVGLHRALAHRSLALHLYTLYCFLERWRFITNRDYVRCIDIVIFAVERPIVTFAYQSPSSPPPSPLLTHPVRRRGWLPLRV